MPNRGVTAAVEDAVRTMIANGSPGDLLPSERDLARRLHAGRTTVRLVLQRLAAERLIESHHGVGYYIW